jgi:hypothetical protein
MDLVTVFRTFSPAEAQLARSRLEAAEIPCHVAHELASLSIEGYSMATGGICVEAPAERAAEARELLAATEPPAG